MRQMLGMAATPVTRLAELPAAGSRGCGSALARPAPGRSCSSTG